MHTIRLSDGWLNEQSLHLQPQDAILNLTGQRVVFPAQALRAGVLIVQITNDTAVVTAVAAAALETQSLETQIEPCRLGGSDSADDWNPLAAELQSAQAKRLVLLTDSDRTETETLGQAVADVGVELLEATIPEETTADDFMDEQDTEAVAHRLRQLGYL